MTLRPRGGVLGTFYRARGARWPDKICAPFGWCPSTPRTSSTSRPSVLARAWFCKDSWLGRACVSKSIVVGLQARGTNARTHARVQDESDHAGLHICKHKVVPSYTFPSHFVRTFKTSLAGGWAASAVRVVVGRPAYSGSLWKVPFLRNTFVRRQPNHECLCTRDPTRNSHMCALQDTGT